MAFCNSCGASIEPGNKFCNKCGAAIAGVAPAPVPAQTAAAPGGSSALKIILIIVAVIVCIGILGAAGISYLVYHVAKSAHVTQQGDRVKVETPMGTFTANDTEQTARELGVEMYPGAQMQKQGTASASFGGVHTVAANLGTSDSLDKVCDFYRAKFPDAKVKSSDQNHCSIVSGGPGNSVTISVEASGGMTRIHIASVSKAASSD